MAPRREEGISRPICTIRWNTPRAPVSDEDLRMMDDEYRGVMKQDKTANGQVDQTAEDETD